LLGPSRWRRIVVRALQDLVHSWGSRLPDWSACDTLTGLRLFEESGLGRGETMDANIIGLIIQLAAGLIGGTVVGSRMENVTLGGLGNAVAGALGGLGGGWILGALVPELSGESMDLGTIIGQVVSSGAGGALLTIIAGLIKSALTDR